MSLMPSPNGPNGQARTRRRADGRLLISLRAFVLLVALAFIGTGGALAATSPDEMLADPAKEAQARELTRQLRCVVCQNQSIDDSDADLARDLRRLVRERVAEGESNSEILDYLTARYGEFILLKPPVVPATYALWLAPVLLLLAGSALLIPFLRQRRRAPSARPLNAEEERAVADLLGRAE